MRTYLVTFDGYGANRVTYRDQTLTIQTQHDWCINADEAANVMYLVHQKVKEHFTRYKIVKVELQT
jgi:hypothetical protein